MSDLTVGEAQAQRERNRVFREAEERTFMKGVQEGLLRAAKAECMWCSKDRVLVDGMHVLTGSIAGQLVSCRAQATHKLLEEL